MKYSSNDQPGVLVLNPAGFWTAKWSANVIWRIGLADEWDSLSDAAASITRRLGIRVDGDPDQDTFYDLGMARQRALTLLVDDLMG